MTEEKQRFDPVKFLEASGSILRDLPRYNKGPHLDFHTRCAVYACLYDNRLPQAVVCRVFNLSRSTVSYIAGCRDDDRKPVVIEQDSGLIDERTKLPITHRETMGVEGYLTKNRSEDRRPRYQDVADEFERLGPDEFVKTYLTKRIAWRIMEVRKLLTNKVYLDGMQKTVDRDE